MISCFTKKNLLYSLIVLLAMIYPGINHAQLTSNDTTVIAGAQYAASESYQRRWGKHYRQEWNTAVKIRKVMLDTLAGGLTPYEAGGGRQSKTLRLRDAKGHEYVLRSIDKTFGKALPDIAQGTFIEAIANDQVSIGHPYSAVTIAPLAERAGIFHTNPQIIFIPKQTRLGSFNEDFGDLLYLFEQRPDENWEPADNFGNPANIIGTDKLQEKLMKDNDNQVDQPAYVRARLFDLLIGDWGRHEDQWRWAEFKNGTKTLYKPIPRDRDQAYTLFDGNMVTLLFSMAGFDHLQSFEHTIKDVTTYNFPARNLDRLVTNGVGKEQWIKIAEDLQQRISDQVIEAAIKKLPPEVYPISGPDIISKLKSRRDKLTEFASSYYDFLALNVDIPGSNDSELFDVNRTSDEKTIVRIYKIKKDGSTESQPFYSRTFFTGETEEIRLYGLDGNDRFRLYGSVNQSSLVRVVPGAGDDIVNDESTVGSRGRQTKVYDDEREGITGNRETRIKISNDSARNNYKYAEFKNDSRGMVIRPGATIGIGYHITKQRWRKEPFGNQHRWMGYYGPNRGSFAFEYRYIHNQLIRNWNLEALARADIPLVANFYGIGNESVMNPDVNRKFYRFRSTVYTVGGELNRLFDSTHFVSLHTAVQAIKVRDDENRFIKLLDSGIPATALEQKYFATAELTYQFKKSNHPVVPTKGFAFNVRGGYTQNLSDKSRGFADYGSSVSFYLPILKVLTLAVRAGGETIVGDPEFYQLATLSGKDNLRGFRRQRFYGETSFYNNNELRLMLNTRNGWFNGKIGLLAFVDQGRVWIPGEKSDTWHRGYGGGFFVAPFNKILLNATYGISDEDRVMHIRLGFLF